VIGQALDVGDRVVLMRFPQSVEPPIPRPVVDRYGGDDPRAGLDRVIDRGAGGA
jgi:hypothetical protein